MITTITLSLALKADGDSSDSSEEIYENEYDIVIIGAGVTGLLHSYLLSTESTNNYQHPYSTLTIERYNRLCGRTHSVDIQHNDKSIHFETGAMRFYYNELQQQLFHRLDLCEFITPLMDTLPYPFVPKVNANYIYRNHRIKVGDLNNTNYWQKVYHLTPKVRD